MKFKNKVEDYSLEDFSSGKAPYLAIEAKTWYRDSHGLFDYDSQHVVKSKMNLFLSCFLNKRDDDKILISQATSRCDSDLLSVAYIEGSYYMHNDQGYMWKVLKSVKRNGSRSKPYKLSKGDILKLGRYIFEVKEISSRSENLNLNQSLDNTEIDYKMGMKNDRSSSIIPRSTTLHTAIDYNTLEKELGDNREQNRPLGGNISGSQSSKD